VIETEPKSEKGGDTYNIKAMVTTAIPDYRENPKPYYPIMARKRGHQGTLVLQVEVLSDGTVGRIKLKKSSGYLSLDNSTIEAVKKWKFIPGRRGNIPITMWVNVPVRFELKNRK
jgi:protein TonB